MPRGGWSLALGVVASGPVSAISIKAVRELLAEDLLRALGEIRCAIEQAGEGAVPHRPSASSDSGAGTRASPESRCPVLGFIDMNPTLSSARESCGRGSGRTMPSGGACGLVACQHALVQWIRRSRHMPVCRTEGMRWWLNRGDGVVVEWRVVQIELSCRDSVKLSSTRRPLVIWRAKVSAPRCGERCGNLSFPSSGGAVHPTARRGVAFR